MFRTVLVHHQEQPFISCTSHLVYAGICDVQLIKVAPDDGLTYSETRRASNGK